MMLAIWSSNQLGRRYTRQAYGGVIRPEGCPSGGSAQARVTERFIARQSRSSVYSRIGRTDHT
jgi:hypothetical protein